MKQPEDRESGQRMAQPAEPGKELRVRDRQQMADQRQRNEDQGEMGGEEAVAAEDRWGRQPPIPLRHQIGQQPGIPEEAPLYVEVIEEEYRKCSERDAADRERRDRRPPRRASDR